MMKPFQAGHATRLESHPSTWPPSAGPAPSRFWKPNAAFFTLTAEATIRLRSSTGLVSLDVENPGVSIKPFPSGSLTHPGMTNCCADPCESIRAGDVVQVEVGTNRNMPNTLIHHHPTTGLQAKFSMEFCMAILLLDGRPIRRNSRMQLPPPRRAGDDPARALLH